MNALQLLRQAVAATETEDTASVWLRTAKYLNLKMMPARVQSVAGNLHGVHEEARNGSRDLVFEGQDQEYIYHARFVPYPDPIPKPVKPAQLQVTIHATSLANTKIHVFHSYVEKIQTSAAETPATLVRKVLSLLPSLLENMREKCCFYADRLEIEARKKTGKRAVAATEPEPEQNTTPAYQGWSQLIRKLGNREYRLRIDGEDVEMHAVHVYRSQEDPASYHVRVRVGSEISHTYDYDTGYARVQHQRNITDRYDVKNFSIGTGQERTAAELLRAITADVWSRLQRAHGAISRHEQDEARRNRKDRP